MKVHKSKESGNLLHYFKENHQNSIEVVNQWTNFERTQAAKIVEEIIVVVAPAVFVVVGPSVVVGPDAPEVVGSEASEVVGPEAPEVGAAVVDDDDSCDITAAIEISNTNSLVFILKLWRTIAILQL